MNVYAVISTGFGDMGLYSDVALFKTFEEAVDKVKDLHEELVEEYETLKEDYDEDGYFDDYEGSDEFNMSISDLQTDHVKIVQRTL